MLRTGNECQQTDLRIESERPIEIYDKFRKFCKPDFEIMRKNTNQSLLCIEVKSIFYGLHDPDFVFF